MATTDHHSHNGRRYATIDQAAEYAALSSKTIRRKISDGTIRGYRGEGVRSIRVDLNEVDEWLQPIPTAVKE